MWLWTILANLEDLRRQDMQERENYKYQIQDLKSRCEDRKERVDEERRKFMEFKKQVALNALNSRSGRPIPPKVGWLYVVWKFIWMVLVVLHFV